MVAQESMNRVSLSVRIHIYLPSLLLQQQRFHRKRLTDREIRFPPTPYRAKHYRWPEAEESRSILEFIDEETGICLRGNAYRS